MEFERFTGYNFSKQYEFDEINAVSYSQSKENSIKKEINQIVQNIYYDVSADMIEFSNLSGYQKFVVKSAMKDSEFTILACKCLIVCLAEFIKVRKNKFFSFVFWTCFERYYLFYNFKLKCFCFYIKYVTFWNYDFTF